MKPIIKTRQLQLSNLDDYELYKVALEWGLIEPIVIESEEDLKSAPSWKEKGLLPYDHQISNLISFCRRLPVTLLADDVGLGKTISAGLIASELMSRGRVSKILIVCPKLIMPQWKEELNSKFNIKAIEASGSDLLKATIPEDRGAIITTYNSARMHLEKIVKKGFDFLILDEAHKLRNLHGTNNVPKVAEMFKKVLTNRDFKYVLMLTATPIQNRLWDMYSLIDLLAVARGHENPFGTKGIFARQFIADERDRARQLRQEKREEFRSIVYSQMSRMRRGDAKLSFPERIIQQHNVKPTKQELELIKLISEPIQELDAWSQMSVARALISSPQALAAELESRAKKGAIPESLSKEVRSIANSMGITAKQQGVEILVDQFRKEKPNDWRMVIFTTRRETQTTLEDFLIKKGIKCGIINGDSAPRNQETVAKFKSEPPEINVVISTEAGSEGVNLQDANVLVNYDLPWNPMVVEQRIGRVQRLASKHANVCIFNIVLQGTFEEFVVGRLMEKLLMASHAIGDIEALLEAAGIDEDDSEPFEEKIRKLVIDALAGINIDKALRLHEESILKAKAQLESAEQNLNNILGSGDSYEYDGPKCPKLAKPNHSLDVKTFSEKAVKSLGGKLTSQGENKFLLEIENDSKVISFNEDKNSPPFGPGHSDFERIVTGISNNGKHVISDVDEQVSINIEKMARDWVNTFEGSFDSLRIEKIAPCFAGKALVRARVSIKHDSYERLVEVDCIPQSSSKFELEDLEPLPKFIRNPEQVGIDPSFLIDEVSKEENIAEFCRFYNERLQYELVLGGNSDRVRKKLEDDFTPHIQAELVGFCGQFYRQIDATVFYKLDTTHIYRASLSIIPCKNELIPLGKFITCEISKKSVPEDCVSSCVITGQMVIKHYLKKSDLSGRWAIPDKIVTCALSGKQLLSDEVQKSDATGLWADPRLLQKSDISNKFAEPQYLEICAFTNAKCLVSELVLSQISGKKFRVDQQLRSSVSGFVGHDTEFILCSETKQPLALTEVERCEMTGKNVAPGVLEICRVTGKKVLPSELGVCVVSHNKALKISLVKSSLSNSDLIASMAVKSRAGNYCTPTEARKCNWTEQKLHPNDLAKCRLTNLEFNEALLDKDSRYFNSLANLLDGRSLRIDRQELSDEISNLGNRAFSSSKCTVEATEISPDGNYLAVCLKVSKFLGLFVKYAGFLYSIKEKTIIGRISLGKRENGIWTSDSEGNSKVSAA